MTTPSTDPMNEKAWSWLSGPAKQRVTRLRGHTRGVSLTAQSAAYVQGLARRIGLDPEELAARIPVDTLRRLKYSMITHLHEDGKRSFEHDLGITEGVKSLLATDRGTDGATSAPTPRDDSGRFVKK